MTTRNLTQSELEGMTVRELRRYAIDAGYGIRYLSERPKAEIIQIIQEIDAQFAQPKEVLQ